MTSYARHETQQTESNTDELEFVKTQNFYSSKCQAENVDQQSTDWRKIYPHMKSMKASQPGYMEDYKPGTLWTSMTPISYEAEAEGL